MTNNVFDNPAKRITFNGLDIEQAELFPTFYWFDGLKQIGKKNGFSLVTKILDNDNGSKEYCMRDDYYYRGIDEMKIYYKLFPNPFIAKMVRTCKENPDFDITLKICPEFDGFDIDEVGKLGRRGKLKFEKFTAVLENPHEKYLSKVYVNIMKNLTDDINSAVRKRRHDHD